MKWNATGRMSAGKQSEEAGQKEQRRTLVVAVSRWMHPEHARTAEATLKLKVVDVSRSGSGVLPVQV
jgi:hypothetical protein